MVRSVHKLFKLTHNQRIANLPKPYLDYLEKSREPKERVVDDAPQTDYLDYKQDHDTGYVYRVPDQPIDVVYPRGQYGWLNADHGLWAGLGLVQAFEKPKRLKPRINRTWDPTIEKHTFYSDILDVHINIHVTDRTLELIDKNNGFDFYILATPVQDLCSEFGRRLQHKMLVKLAQEDRDYVKEKYKDYIRPLDEVVWHGLKENEALTRFHLMRIEETIEPPLKIKFARELIDQLKAKKAQQIEASK